MLLKNSDSSETIMLLPNARSSEEITPVEFVLFELLDHPLGVFGILTGLVVIGAVLAKAISALPFVRISSEPTREKEKAGRGAKSKKDDL